MLGNRKIAGHFLFHELINLGVAKLVSSSVLKIHKIRIIQCNGIVFVNCF